MLAKALTPVKGALAGAVKAVSPKAAGEVESHNVVIIGAGPAGLMAACTLAKAGVDCTVFELREQQSYVQVAVNSYHIEMSTRGIAALKSVGNGVADRILAQGWRIDELHVVRTGGKVDPKKCMVQPTEFNGIAVFRHLVVEGLFAEAERLGVRINWGHKLKGMDVKAQTLTFEHGGRLKTVHVQKACVGCDGVHSHVREYCIEQTGLPLLEKVAWGRKNRFVIVPAPEDDAWRKHQAAGGKAPVGLMQSKGAKYSDGLHPTSKDGLHPPNMFYIYGHGDGATTMRREKDGAIILAMSMREHAAPFLYEKEYNTTNGKKLCDYVDEQCGGAAARNLRASEEAQRTFFKSSVFSGEMIKVSTLAPAEWIALVGDSAHAVTFSTGEVPRGSRPSDPSHRTPRPMAF